MPKGVSDAGEAPTKVAALREALGALEAGLGALRGAGAVAAAELLRQRDRAAMEMARLEGRGADLRSEQTRLQGIDLLLRSRAAAILRELGGAGGLAAARGPGSAAEGWWWHLDKAVAARRRRRWGRGLAAALILAVVLAGVSRWIDRRWGPSPEERAYQQQMVAGEQALSAGDRDAARAAYGAAAAMQPGSAEAQAMVGVLAEATGRGDEAARALAAARAASADEGSYLVWLARGYQRAGLAERGLEAATAAIAAPTSQATQAEAYLVRGGIAEELGREAAALADYGQAADLAAAAGLTELEALARARYALLMQRGPGLPTESTE